MMARPSTSSAQMPRSSPARLAAHPVAAPAEELLETAGLPIETVADRAGFGTSAALREQFVRRRGGPPRDYRRAFRTA